MKSRFTKGHREAIFQSYIAWFLAIFLIFSSPLHAGSCPTCQSRLSVDSHGKAQCNAVGMLEQSGTPCTASTLLCCQQSATLGITAQLGTGSQDSVRTLTRAFPENPFAVTTRIHANPCLAQNASPPDWQSLLRTLLI
jgi:hypothetical protein